MSCKNLTDYYLDLRIGNYRLGFVKLKINNNIQDDLAIQFHSLLNKSVNAVVKNNQKLVISYLGTKVYKIVESSYFELGDISCNNGSGNYGACKPQKRIDKKISNTGFVGVFLNNGRTKNSAFFISLGPVDLENGKYCILGKAYMDKTLINSLNSFPVNDKHQVLFDMYVGDLGVLDKTVVHRINSFNKLVQSHQPTNRDFPNTLSAIIAHPLMYYISNKTDTKDEQENTLSN